MLGKLRLILNRNWMRRGFDLYLYAKDENGASVAENVTFIRIDEHIAAAATVQPLYIPEESAQEIIDQLWTAGFRPEGYADSAGVVRAKDEHIKDLRLVLNAFVSMEAK